MPSLKISDLTEKTTGVSTDKFEIEEADGTSKSMSLDTISSYAGGGPVGTWYDWDKSMPGATTLPDVFKEGDGTFISDSDSPFNGYRIRNLNGADVVLTLTWTADAGGSYTTVTATDVTALAEGDFVTGSGIAANSYITDVTGTTVTITDTAASGSISSTFTNNGDFICGGITSGVGKKDQTQKLTGDFAQTSSNVDSNGIFSLENKTASAGARIDASTFTGTTSFMVLDSSNSPNARTSADTFGETYPTHRTMVKIMKIK